MSLIKTATVAGANWMLLLCCRDFMPTGHGDRHDTGTARRGDDWRLR